MKAAASPVSQARRVESGLESAGVRPWRAQPDAPRRHLDLNLWSIVAVAVAVRLAWLLLVVNRQWSDVTYYDESARHLAHHLELRFIDPLVPSIHYRAWFPPGWPFFLALFYRVFGDSAWLVKIVNLMLAALVVWLTVRLGTHLFGRRAALVGGLLLALLPGQVFYVGLAQYEIFLTALVTAALLLLVEGPWNHKDVRSPLLHTLGVLLAWATLTRPLLVLLPLALAPYLVRAGGRRRGWVCAGVLAAYVGLACAGWGLRNIAVLGEPVLFSTNGGYNLWHGNNPNATGGAFTPPPSPDPRLNPMLLEDNELVMNRQCYRYAVDYIRARPSRFIAMIPQRLYHLYNTDTTSLYISFLYTPLDRPTALQAWRDNPHFIESLTFRSYAVTMLLVLLGFLVADWRSPHLRLIAAVLLYWHFWVALTFGQDRYRVPIMPVYCLFAGYGVQRIGTFIAQRGWLRGR